MNKSSLIIHSLVLVITIGQLLICSSALAKPSWKQISQEEGIRVYTKEIKNQSFPWFRGESVMNATVSQISDILLDINSGCEWTARCVNTYVVKKLSKSSAVFYTRTDAPWPISDRDTVLLGTVKKIGDGILMTFVTTDNHNLPVPDGVVRIPKFKGIYRLIPKKNNRTKVVFEVQANPGGWIPTWMANWASKAIPLDTLKGLKGRIVQKHGKRRSN